PEGGLRLDPLAKSAPTTRRLCCPMVMSWSLAAVAHLDLTASVPLILLIPRSCMIQAQGVGAPPAVSVRLIKISRRRCCRTVRFSLQPALPLTCLSTSVSTPFSTPQSCTTHLPDHGALPAALIQNAMGTQRRCYPTVRFWSQAALEKAAMSLPLSRAQNCSTSASPSQGRSPVSQLPATA